MSDTQFEHENMQHVWCVASYSSIAQGILFVWNFWWYTCLKLFIQMHIHYSKSLYK